MKRTNILFALLLSTLFMAVSCAVTPDEDSDDGYDHMMKAWMRLNYPSVQPYGSGGAYILQMDKGSGPAIKDTAFIRAHYTKRSLDGSISETNVKELAGQLGTYSVSSCFDGNTWQLGKGYLPDALEEVIYTMNSGGSASIAVPLSVSEHEYAIYDAFSITPEISNYVYDLTIDTVLNDIYAYQESAMRTWFQTHYAISDTLVEHLYFKKLEEKSGENDSIPEGNSIKVRYIGRLMSGQVFDTNIEDTAKFYRIWNGSGSYSGLEISFYKKDDSEFEKNNSVVTGFGKAIQQMNYGETAVTLFGSKLGYGAAGSNPSIPEYSPLFFWIYIEPEE